MRVITVGAHARIGGGEWWVASFCSPLSSSLFQYELATSASNIADPEKVTTETMKLQQVHILAY